LHYDPVGAKSADSDGRYAAAENEQDVNGATSQGENWGVLIAFLVTVLGLFAYLVASIGGWIDWLLWAPALIADLGVGWLCAMRINSSAEQSSLTG